MQKDKNSPKELLSDISEDIMKMKLILKLLEEENINLEFKFYLSTFAFLKIFCNKPNCLTDNFLCSNIHMNQKNLFY